MEVKYDKENNTIYIQLSNKPITESDSKKPGIIFDHDSDNNIGIEILKASTKMELPHENGI